MYTHVCMYVCMYVSMYVCVYVCMYLYIYISIERETEIYTEGEPEMDRFRKVYKCKYHLRIYCLLTC